MDRSFILMVSLTLLPNSLWAKSESLSVTVDQNVANIERRAEFQKRISKFTKDRAKEVLNAFNADRSFSYSDADYALPNDEPALQERIRQLKLDLKTTKTNMIKGDGGKCVEIKRELESLQHEYEDIFTQDEPVLNISTLSLIRTCQGFLDKLDERMRRLTAAMNSGLQMLAARHGGVLPAEFQAYALTSSQSEDVELSMGGGISTAGAETQASQSTTPSPDAQANLSKSGKDSAEANTQAQRKETRTPASTSTATSPETTSGDDNFDFGFDTPGVGSVAVVAGAGGVAGVAGSSTGGGSSSPGSASQATTGGGTTPSVNLGSAEANSELGYRKFFALEIEHFQKQNVILTTGSVSKDQQQNHEQSPQAYAQHVFSKTPLIGADYRNQNMVTLAFTGPNHETRGVRMTRWAGPQTREQKSLDFPGKLPGRLLFTYPQKEGPESSEGKALNAQSEKVQALYEANLLLAIKLAFECHQRGVLPLLQFVQQRLADKPKLSEEETRVKRNVDTLIQFKEILEYPGGPDRLNVCDVIAIGPAFAVFPNATIEKVESEIKSETHPIHLKNPKLTKSLEHLRRFIPYVSQLTQTDLLRAHPEQVTIKPACVLGPNFTKQACRYQDPKHPEDILMIGAQVYAMVIDIQAYLFTLRDPLPPPPVRVAKGQGEREPPSP